MNWCDACKAMLEGRELKRKGRLSTIALVVKEERETPWLCEFHPISDDRRLSFRALIETADLTATDWEVVE